MSLEPVRHYESQRRFQLWLYTVSHAQLLLRSTRAAGSLTRIDLLFKAVSSLNMPTSTDGLEVQQVEDGVYRLSGPDWQGAVEASAFFVAEDNGEFHDPSAFEQSLMGRA